MSFGLHFPRFTCMLCITLHYLLFIWKLLWDFLFTLLVLDDCWWPCSLHSLSLEAWWHAYNKELIAVLLPKHLEASGGLRVCVMALTGPGDLTVSVKEPQGRFDALVKCHCEGALTFPLPFFFFFFFLKCIIFKPVNKQTWKRNQNLAWCRSCKCKHENQTLFLQKLWHTYKAHTTRWLLWEPFWQLCPELPIRLRELQTPSAITLSCWLHLHNIIEKASGAFVT